MMSAAAGCRTSGLGLFRFRYLLPSPCTPSFAISHSVASSEGLPWLSKEDDEFLPWLEQKAGQVISSALSVGRSIYGRSVFASKFIQFGECILQVPYSVQITPDNILSEIGYFIGDGVSNIARLAVVLSIERKMGQDSEWARYANALPNIDEMHNTIFWSQDELEMVRQSAVYQETLNQQTCIRKEFCAVKSALKHFPHVVSDYTLDDFMHCYALVGSRAWGTSKGLSLIPFADFLNHDGVSEAVLLSDEDKEISEVIADRNYAPGEQVLIRYGKFPNATLLLDFGFTLPHNIYDQVQIQMDVPMDDPLRLMKLKLLYEHHVRTTPTDCSGFNSSGCSFTIKEVKSPRGKGKGIPQSLRAFARILSTSSLEELKALEIEASQNDGRLARLPLKNKSSEIKSHRMLLSRIICMIEDYSSSIESLGLLHHPTGSKFSLRRQMAKDLLAGEVRILKSACSWLVNYCSS